MISVLWADPAHPVEADTRRRPRPRGDLPRPPPTAVTVVTLCDSASTPSTPRVPYPGDGARPAAPSRPSRRARDAWSRSYAPTPASGRPVGSAHGSHHETCACRFVSHSAAVSLQGGAEAHGAFERLGADGLSASGALVAFASTVPARLKIRTTRPLVAAFTAVAAGLQPRTSGLLVATLATISALLPLRAAADVVALSPTVTAGVAGG